MPLITAVYMKYAVYTCTLHAHITSVDSVVLETFHKA